MALEQHQCSCSKLREKSKSSSQRSVGSADQLFSNDMVDYSSHGLRRAVLTSSAPANDPSVGFDAEEI
ncbi:hypothetical protein DPV78_010753 [Talaromyces pinophilus]|nr:hypothetical protein DPV78_010753 [Talaromyces pinophilus]